MPVIVSVWHKNCEGHSYRGGWLHDLLVPPHICQFESDKKWKGSDFSGTKLTRFLAIKTICSSQILILLLWLEWVFLMKRPCHSAKVIILVRIIPVKLWSTLTGTILTYITYHRNCKKNLTYLFFSTTKTHENV